ncbi:2825_t:CDS:2 [Entrophospora sp. SA101]|nr:2820_t:CDS:2 [Entrophospora sp. SA101]CAJ0643881.1 2825_t:CDS:2 [Entrophospora sp. SA101]
MIYIKSDKWQYALSVDICDGASDDDVSGNNVLGDNDIVFDGAVVDYDDEAISDVIDSLSILSLFYCAIHKYSTPYQEHFFEAEKNRTCSFVKAFEMLTLRYQWLNLEIPRLTLL